MPEREDNPGTSETRDFEIPPMEAGDPAAPGGAGEVRDPHDGPAPPEPAEESERRDWDLP